jgi:hypothetical protein
LFLFPSKGGVSLKIGDDGKEVEEYVLRRQRNMVFHSYDTGREQRIGSTSLMDYSRKETFPG